MSLPNIFSNRSFRITAIIIAAVILSILILNIFIIGGDTFVINFNSSLNSPLAIIITISAVGLWHLMSAERHNRLLWLGILIGWSMWALAETIWAVYLILGQEVPYPSLADLFWIAGYLPMGVGLITRIRTIPVKPSRSQNLLIFGVSTAMVLVTFFFVILPILQYFDPQRLLESILNITYPLADLFLVIVCLRLLFTYEEGDYGFGWRLLTIGFIFMTVSDLIYSYAVWQEVYYPDMKATMLSTLAVDVPYTVSYLLWFLGIFALRILLKETSNVSPEVKINRVRNYGHILIYTRNDDTVFDVSPNYDHFFKTADIKGRSLADVLTISEHAGNSINMNIHQQGEITDFSIQIPDRSGNMHDAWLCGVAVLNTQQGFMGANLLLRILVDDLAFDEILNHDSRRMVQFILNKSGSNYRAEIGRFLSDYYLYYLRSLLDMASHQGGDIMSQGLLDKLSETVHAKNWPLEFNPRTILESSNYPFELLREALPTLLETAKKFVSDLTGVGIVEDKMRELSSQFNRSVHADVEYYLAPGSQLEFSREQEEKVTTGGPAQ